MARAQRLGCLEALVLKAALPTEAASTGNEVAALLALRLRRARRRLASRGVSQAPACFCRGQKLRKPVFQHHVPLKGHPRSEAATRKTTENDFYTMRRSAAKACAGRDTGDASSQCPCGLPRVPLPTVASSCRCSIVNRSSRGCLSFGWSGESGMSSRGRFVGVPMSPSASWCGGNTANRS